MNRSEPLPVTVLCGLADPREAASAPALPPFDSRVLAFLSDLSAALLADRRVKAFPDVTTFAFFCRRASLENLRKPYGTPRRPAGQQRRVRHGRALRRR